MTPGKLVLSTCMQNQYEPAPYDVKQFSCRMAYKVTKKGPITQILFVLFTLYQN